MALNIKNTEVERLAAEVAAMTGETKTEAVRRALDERARRLRLRSADAVREERLTRFLEREIWSRVPDGARAPSKPEREAILGIGESGA